MARLKTPPPNQELVTEVACPHCAQRVAVPVPNREVDPTVSPHAVLFGDYTTSRCSAGHKFWVYYC